MGDFITQKNIGALIDVVPITPTLSWTAAGSGDAAKNTGLVIDRAAFTSGMPHQLDVAILWDTTLASASTLSFALQLEDSADGSTFANYSTAASEIGRAHV